jgi:hypothetical protein
MIVEAVVAKIVAPRMRESGRLARRARANTKRSFATGC